MPVRIDYEYIEDHVPSGARVLDLGCGDGGLLARLQEEKDVSGQGIEIDEEAVRECIKRGVPVYHGDMLEGMRMFPDDEFDCVILSQTLQQALRPAEVVEEMLRVGRVAIISFPNFGHWTARLRLLFNGSAPVTPTLPYTWYETPNLRVITVRDFHHFCEERNLKIVDSMFFTPSYVRLPSILANLFASIAIFVVECR
ncbi:MAG: methionine biosynthesis protein MetW [Planctomycetota bacterium]